MKRSIFAPLLFIVLSLSCSTDNNCDTVIQGTSFTIIDSTKVYLSNYFNHDRVIFEDVTSGEEMLFEIDRAIDTITEYQTDAECSENPDLFSQLIGNSEIRDVQLRNTSNGIILSIQHRSALNILKIQMQ